MRCTLFCLGLSVFAGSVALRSQTLPPAPPSSTRLPPVQMDAETQRAVSWAIERGTLLFGIDRAAWVASDDALARLPAHQQGGIAGYLVDAEPGGFVAIFYAREADRYVAVYRGHVRGQGVTSRDVFGTGQRPALTPVQQRMAMALQQLQAAMPPLVMCNRSRPNYAVIPPAARDAPVDIYVMTPQTGNESIPLGGHHKVTIGRDGQMIARRAFTNSCIDLPTAAAARRPAALVVSHVLDQTPTEIHVFSALALGLPLYVYTAHRTWRVNGSAITLLADDRQATPLRDSH